MVRVFLDHTYTSSFKGHTLTPRVGLGCDPRILTVTGLTFSRLRGKNLAMVLTDRRIYNGASS